MNRNASADSISYILNASANCSALEIYQRQALWMLDNADLDSDSSRVRLSQMGSAVAALIAIYN